MNKVIVDANNKWSSYSLKEIFNYKDLFLLLAYRDFKVRYAQTVLGFLWAFLQPATTLVIFTLIFGKAIKVDTGNIPYPLFALSGLVAWTYFSFLMTNAGSSIIGAQAMVQKVYFPRLIIPLSKAIVGFVDFAIVFFFLFILMIYHGYYLRVEILMLPVFLILNILAGLSVGIWLSALTIRYRDFQNITPFAVQVGMYLTPIAYPVSLIPEKFKLIYYFNPMTGIIEGYRWCLFGMSPPDIFSYISILATFILLLSGIVYFKKMESVMSDII
jgi:lipopolysaccharide transport system permease protein